MGFYIPDSLKSLNNWVLWKLEDCGRNKLSKVPYKPNGKRARSTVRTDWTSYEEALTVYTYSGCYSGLGFVFAASDELVFIDLDECLDTNGEPNEYAKEVLDMFKGTYVEISQSEKGLHIICKGRIPRAIKRKEIEIYSDKRYMAFTGNAYEAAEPQNAQSALDALIRKYDRLPTKKRNHNVKEQANSSPTKEFSLTARKVIYTILNSPQKEKFAMLNRGEWQEKYKSQSEADQAMICILNYYCAGENSLIEEIFFCSALGQRKKAHRQEYVSTMIMKAKKTYKEQKRGTRPTRKRRF